jgi:hypothetical protein
MTSTLTPAAQARSSSGGGAQGIYWGAWIGNIPSGEAAPWDMNAVTSFVTNTRKAPSIIHFYQSFMDCALSCTFNPLPTTQFSEIRQRGAIPMLSWGSDTTPVGSEGSNLSLSAIADGSLDGYLTRVARQAKRWGHPFFLRFDWEMNGNWFPWGVATPGNTAAEYVAAWRHVHDVFAAQGANNVTWVWCPNTGWDTSQRDQYPGNAYVDWTCLDGYNWGTGGTFGESYGGWQSFSKIYKKSYRALLKVAPNKPIMVGEFASTNIGGSKPRWIANALATIPRKFKKIAAIVYFDDADSGMDWPINSSPGSALAFARGISNSVYASNVFGRLSDRLITPYTG